MPNQHKAASRVQGGSVARARERSAAIQRRSTTTRFVVCIDDGGYVDDLKVKTIYQVLPDESAAKSNYIRIIDETGEDYLYPADLFAPIDLSRKLEKVLLAAG
jgi:hypothetical protein